MSVYEKGLVPQQLANKAMLAAVKDFIPSQLAKFKPGRDKHHVDVLRCMHIVFVLINNNLAYTLCILLLKISRLLVYTVGIQFI